uniref:Uncharacterized protein n=1 Tax=Salarias fasciatus TaxID=181472 RepID=A0A672GCE9_SALFA
MLVAAGAITLLHLLSVSLSAPLGCEELLRPSIPVGPHHLEGRWALVGGSLSNPEHLQRFRERGSVAVDFFGNSNETDMSYTRSMRSKEEECSYSSYNITLEGSGFSFRGEGKRNYTANFLSTCPDCLLMHLTHQLEKRQHLYLFSRRRELEPFEMDHFTLQVGCLNMSSPAVMDPTKELCPEKDWKFSLPEEAHTEKLKEKVFFNKILVVF